ncbi:MAG: trypsin-like peptidase domain-containing protein [Gemmatimonadota bacterium]
MDEPRGKRRAVVWVLVALLAAFLLGLALGLSASKVEDSSVENAARPAGEGRLSGLASRSPAPMTEAAGESGQTAARSGAESAEEIGRAAPWSSSLSPEGESREATLSQASRRFTPIVEAARRVTPSVVSVTVLRRERVIPRSLFDIFVPRGFERTVQGLGSGFAIDTDGHILTNHHVVRDADSVVVADATGRIYRAEILGSDELTDVAVLKVPSGRIPPAPLGTSSDLMVGEPAIAIGNPFGYLLANSEATVTTGVISGVGRDIRSDMRSEVLYADMVQTDASINPGNSGGPLVNADGKVIGVNSSIFSRSGGSEGLGFAIPIDRALRIADELREFGRIRRAWVGIDVIALDSDTLRGETVVRRVAEGSPADRAGLRPNDVLVALDGRPIASPLDWEVGLLDAGVNAEVTVRYRRHGRTRTASLRIHELPSEMAERVEVFRGLQLITVTPQIAAERRLRVDAGAMIIAIDPRTVRATGMREGDVIVSINRNEVTDTQRANELFRYYAGRGYITVVFYRGRTAYSTSFRLS